MQSFCRTIAHHCTSSDELDVSTFESAGRRVGWGRSVRAASCRGATKTGQPGKRILTLLAWEESLPCSTRTGCCQPAGRPTLLLRSHEKGRVLWRSLSLHDPRFSGSENRNHPATIFSMEATLGRVKVGTTGHQARFLSIQRRCGPRGHPRRVWCSGGCRYCSFNSSTPFLPT